MFNSFAPQSVYPNIGPPQNRNYIEPLPEHLIREEATKESFTTLGFFQDVSGLFLEGFVLWYQWSKTQYQFGNSGLLVSTIPFFNGKTPAEAMSLAQSGTLPFSEIFNWAVTFRASDTMLRFSTGFYFNILATGILLFLGGFGGGGNTSQKAPLSKTIIALLLTLGVRFLVFIYNVINGNANYFTLDLTLYEFLIQFIEIAAIYFLLYNKMGSRWKTLFLKNN